MQTKLFDDIVGEDSKPQPGGPDGPRPVNHVAFVLDFSGSMETISEKSRWSFNEQIQTLKKESHDQDTYVTLVSFSDTANTVYNNKHIDDVEELASYSVFGMTALYDAIALTISNLRLNMKPDGNEAALVFIVTDGEENYSQEHKGERGRKTIKGYIKKLEDEGNWTFTFLGANIDVENVAVDGMSFKLGNTMSFDATAEGVSSYTSNASRGISDFYGARRTGETQSNDFFNKDDEQTTGGGGSTITTGGGSLDGKV